MSQCQAKHERLPAKIHDHQTCFACRPDGHKQNIEPLLTPGVFYPKCALLVEPEVGCEPLTLLVDVDKEKDRIVAVTSCDVDLTLTTEEENCPTGVYTNIALDPNYICWPEGTTKEQVDALQRTMKGCVWFINRMTCSVVPPELQYLLETKTAAKAQNAVKTLEAAPRTETTDNAESPDEDSPVENPA